MTWNTTAERGSLAGMHFVLGCLRLTGVRVARIVSEAPILWHFLFSPSVRRASRDYLRRVAAYPEGRKSLGGEPGLFTSWQHLRAFGHGMLDRACFWANRHQRFQIDFPQRELFRRLEAERRGVLFLGAHLGTIDVLRAVVARKSVVVNSLVWRGSTRKFNALLASVDPEQAARIIEIDPGSIQCVLDVKACVDRGEFVALLGDRPELASAKRAARVPFLGGEATFPLGPYWLAHLLECPVYLIFALKRGPDRYEICLEPFAERILLDRKHREASLRTWLERYVRRLEAQCLATPLQWFNFYDFWRADDRAAEQPAEPEPADGARRAQEA